MRTLAFTAMTGIVMAGAVGLVVLLKPEQATPQSSSGRDGPPHELDAPDKPEKPAACVATYDLFVRVQQGKSDRFVRSIMGCEGELVGQQRAGYHNYRTFRWDGERPGSSMVVTFSDHVVNSTYQLGLK